MKSNNSEHIDNHTKTGKYSIIPVDQFKSPDKLGLFSCIPDDFNDGGYKCTLSQYGAIDNFLLKQSVNYSNKNLVKTFLLRDNYDNVISFVSFSASNQILYKSFKKAKPEIPTVGRNLPLPSIDIVYFAVDHSYQHQGIGSLWLGETYSFISAIAQLLGACVACVNSLYDAVDFYTKRGFISVGGGQSRKYGNEWLAIPINDVLKLRNGL
jgi:GNAT superfamily N-acetyltransferase